MPVFFEPEPGLMIWTIISFGVFLFLMWRFALGPIVDMLDKRRNTIEENLEKAEQARDEAERLFQDYQRKLNKAKKEAHQIIQDGKQMGEKLKGEMLEEARKESDSLREKAIHSIELEKEKAVQDLKETAARLSVDIASRVLKREISQNEHRDIIDEVLSEVRKSSES